MSVFTSAECSSLIHNGMKCFLKQKSYSAKGQLITKANFHAVNSSKKRTNEFVFTTMQRVFVRFFLKKKTPKKTFQNYLTFSITAQHTVQAVIQT